MLLCLATSIYIDNSQKYNGKQILEFKCTIIEDFFILFYFNLLYYKLKKKKLISNKRWKIFHIIKEKSNYISIMKKF